MKNYQIYRLERKKEKKESILEWKTLSFFYVLKNIERVTIIIAEESVEKETYKTQIYAFIECFAFITGSGGSGVQPSIDKCVLEFASISLFIPPFSILCSCTSRQRRRSECEASTEFTAPHPCAVAVCEGWSFARAPVPCHHRIHFSSSRFFLFGVLLQLKKRNRRRLSELRRSIFLVIIIEEMLLFDLKINDERRSFPFCFFPVSSLKHIQKWINPTSFSASFSKDKNQAADSHTNRRLCFNLLLFPPFSEKTIEQLFSSSRLFLQPLTLVKFFDFACFFLVFPHFFSRTKKKLP